MICYEVGSRNKSQLEKNKWCTGVYIYIHIYRKNVNQKEQISLFCQVFFFEKKKSVLPSRFRDGVLPWKKKKKHDETWAWKTFRKTIFWGRNLIRSARFRNTQDDSKPATRRREFGNGAKASRLHVHEQSANAAELCLGNFGEIKSKPKKW